MDDISMIGLDTAKSVFQVCVIGSDEAVLKNIRLKRRQLVDYFAALPPSPVAVEACAASYHWARQLLALGHSVKLVPPPFLKRFRGPHKNDARDAHALALAGGHRQLRPVPVKSEDQQAALMTMKVRRLLVGQHTQAANSLRAMLGEFGHIAPRGEKGLESLVQRVESGEAPVPSRGLEALAILVRQWRGLGFEIASLSATLVGAARSDADSVRLMSVPGVGPLIAQACLVKTGDASRFACGRDFAAWLGLVPKQKSTAKSLKLGSITKAGDEDLRSLLVMGAASVLIRAKARPASADPWVAGILRRKKFKVAAVALAARMARILWALMRHGGVYRPRSSSAPQPKAA